MFQKILVANRGEIAVRVIRSCRAMGITTVAVFSEIDRNSLHVLEADEAVCLGEPEPHKSYLCIEKVLEAAKKTGAEAIHPGYGFLSENADFAQACMDAGLIWVGPKPEVIQNLGDKLIARSIMAKNQVPMVAGANLEGTDISVWKKQAESIGYPLLIKAAAGGGGKGMRVVDHPDQFENAIKTAGSEAKAAFGDARVYMERYVSNPRHIEFQILADEHGNVVHLFERECSIQRRHQKIIEETPSPILTEAKRKEMGEVAIQVAKASNYTNAGTVEFLYDPQTHDFFFLEVNTRLQVEHPITEMITGLDLVEWQCRVASGEKLPWKQEELVSRGHAFECRVYAEDPQNQFAPSPGDILALHEPQGPGIRIDSGVYAGSQISVYYDPIVSKIVSYAENREASRKRMLDTLRNYQVLGIQTGIPLLCEIFEHPDFVAGNITTHFLEEHFKDWKLVMEEDDLALIGATLLQLLPAKTSQRGASENGISQQPTPWQTLGSWRM